MQTDAPKPEMSPVPIWRCTNAECKVWIREELAVTGPPVCPMCKGSMIRGIKHLPKLIKKYKAAWRKNEEAARHQ